MTGAAAAAEYVVARLRELAKHRFHQGRRAPPLPLDSAIDSPALRLVAEHRLYALGELEARGLIGWAGGTRDAALYARPIAPSELVELQAEGRRCVSLLEDAPAREGLDFALHDLRHLEKFFDPAHHLAQIGFFRMFRDAAATPGALDLELDRTWISERDTVLSDMNGCPIFLLAVLKMKLKVAVRRARARSAGLEPPARGALTAEELEAYGPVLERFLDALGLSGNVRAAARAISARRDDPHHARVLLQYLTERGNA